MTDHLHQVEPPPPPRTPSHPRVRSRTSAALAAGVSIVALACLVSSDASAGAKLSQNSAGYFLGTWGDPNVLFVNGAFGEIRNSPGTTSYAACGTNGGTGFCSLIETDGTYRSCFTNEPMYIDVIRSMSGDSLFSVSFRVDTGECQYVLSYTASHAAPKGP